jgi:tetratricopeptide (TPR) repeat protein
MFSAACVRYEMEFLPTLMLLAVIGIFSLERALANRPALRRVVRLGYGLLLTFSVASNLFAGVTINADTHAKLGYAFLQTGRVDEATAHLRKALEIRPSLPSPHNYLGWILLQKGDVDRAINEFQEAVRLKPDDAEARNNRAIVLGVKEASAKP